MMFRLAMLLLCAVFTLVSARPRVVVERDSTLMNRVDPNMQPYYIPGTDTSAPRMVIDPGAMVYQMQVDSINKAAEDKIREQIIALEKHFEDPEFEEKTGASSAQSSWNSRWRCSISRLTAPSRCAIRCSSWACRSDWASY
ncbi:MAG: hypothetical protein IPH10_12525 [bacterium]|nr:hypothetical protein [bacterium]